MLAKNLSRGRDLEHAPVPWPSGKLPMSPIPKRCSRENTDHVDRGRPLCHATATQPHGGRTNPKRDPNQHGQLDPGLGPPHPAMAMDLAIARWSTAHHCRRWKAGPSFGSGEQRNMAAPSEEL